MVVTFCERCGYPNPLDSEYCERCGDRIVFSHRPSEQEAAAWLAGINALEEEDFDFAIFCFSEVLKYNSESSEVYLNRGSAYCSKGEYYKGMQDYYKATDLDPNNATAWYNLGLTFKAMGNDKQANICFQRYRELE